jgi:DNA-damage-inducible protein D
MKIYFGKIFFVLLYPDMFTVKRKKTAMSEIEKIENQECTFEDFKNSNGLVYWWASELMRMMGYPNMKSFQNVINRAIKAFISLNIPHYENIISETNLYNGEEIQDFKLTRFACYIIVMNGDPRKEEVAKAQAYFAKQTRKFELYLENSNQIERILIREELAEGNTSLSSTAKSSGVIDYAKFHNAGYLGLYNMGNWQLAKKRNIEKKKLFDSMGKTELAANLFRVTLTNERIKNKGIKGQAALEETHRLVGNEIRKVVVEQTGVRPENLPQEKEIPSVKKELKKGYKK